MYKKAKYLTMDTKKIKALLVALDRGSLSSAAGELGYTQSGLTHMMNSLEDELGLNILVRSKQGVSLTGAGQALLPDLLALSQAAEALEQSAEQLRERSYSTLRLGAYSSISRHWLPSILSAFQRISPDMEVAVTMSSIKDIYEAVKSGSLDCAIVSRQSSLMQGLTWIPLRDDELVAVLPPDDESGDVFPVEGFNGQDFLMPSSGFELDINPVFGAAQGKIVPRIKYTNLDDDTLVSMVAHGLGITILSRLVLQSVSIDVRILPLSPASYRSLGLIMSERHQNDRNVKRLIRCAQDTISRMYSK